MQELGHTDASSDALASPKALNRKLGWFRKVRCELGHEARLWFLEAQVYLDVATYTPKPIVPAPEAVRSLRVNPGLPFSL